MIKTRNMPVFGFCGHCTGYTKSVMIPHFFQGFSNGSMPESSVGGIGPTAGSAPESLAGPVASFQQKDLASFRRVIIEKNACILLM